MKALKIPGAIFRGLKRISVVTYLVLVALLGTSALLMALINDLSRTYVLVHLEPMAGMMMPVEKLYVTQVTHQADGAICFINAQSPEHEHGCVKASAYILREAQ